MEKISDFLRRARYQDGQNSGANHGIKMSKNLQIASGSDARSDINYPLVEESRPRLYRAMKYWGKKPHNIWSEYINRYCPLNGVVVDPFAGSAIAAFEAVKAGRRAIAFDLNPLTSFMIEVMASEYNEQEFLNSATQIRKTLESSTTYQDHYIRRRNGQIATVLNYRWEHENVVKVAIATADGERSVAQADAIDNELAQSALDLTITDWFPTNPLPKHPSITRRFVTYAGGDTIDKLWTRRNLSLLSSMFSMIMESKSFRCGCNSCPLSYKRYISVRRWLFLEM